jgi:multiple sugar transport system permease protein
MTATRTMHRSSALLLAPALVALVVFILGPALSLTPIAFTDWELGLPHLRFVGLKNFVALIEDPYFVAATWHTFLYTAVVAPSSLALGLGAALLIDGAGPLRHVYRGVMFLPAIATMTAMSVAWEALLHPTVGIVNLALRNFGIAGPNWLQDEHTALATLMVIGIWQNFGLAMVFFLAGLRAIPRELREAASLDGIHGPLDTFRHITWPLLGPVALFILILSAQHAFAVFDSVQVLTQGGPGTSSEVLLHFLFVEGIERLRAGYGAAVAITYLALLVSLVLLQRRLVDTRVHYQ